MKVLHTPQQGQGEARPNEYYNNFVAYSDLLRSSTYNPYTRVMISFALLASSAAHGILLVETLQRLTHICPQPSPAAIGPVNLSWQICLCQNFLFVCLSMSFSIPFSFPPSFFHFPILLYGFPSIRFFFAHFVSNLSLSFSSCLQLGTSALRERDQKQRSGQRGPPRPGARPRGGTRTARSRRSHRTRSRQSRGAQRAQRALQELAIFSAISGGFSHLRKIRKHKALPLKPRVIPDSTQGQLDQLDQLLSISILWLRLLLGQTFPFELRNWAIANCQRHLGAKRPQQHSLGNAWDNLNRTAKWCKMYGFIQQFFRMGWRSAVFLLEYSLQPLPFQRHWHWFDMLCACRSTCREGPWLHRLNLRQSPSCVHHVSNVSKPRGMDRIGQHLTMPYSLLENTTVKVWKESVGKIVFTTKSSATKDKSSRRSSDRLNQNMVPRET